MANWESPAFPEGTKFNELFTIIPESESRDYHRETPAWEWTDSTGHVYKHRKGEDKSKISGYFSFSTAGKYRESIYVKPSQKLLEYIDNNMLIINRDSIYFKGIIRDDGTIDILAEYNLIIGSNYLGTFQLSEMGL